MRALVGAFRIRPISMPLMEAVVFAAGIAVPILLLIAIANVFPSADLALSNPRVVLSIAVLVVGLAALTLGTAANRQDSGVVAMLVASSPWIPGTLALVTVGLSLMPAVRELAIILGTLITGAIWLLAGLLFRNYATANASNPSMYAQLLDRRARLEAELANLPAAPAQASPDTVAVRNAAQAEARLCLEQLTTALGSAPDRSPSGLAWVTAAAYMAQWRRLHRAEEALIILAPTATVLASATSDKLRLIGSEIGNTKKLVGQVDNAVATLMRKRPASELELGRARGDLRVVRYEINKYRDERWESFVRGRSNLLKAMIFTGLTAYALLVLALVFGVDRTAILAGSAFYLVGAIIGLFARMRDEAASPSTVEDYGLTEARLIHTPLASGLAAVAGVVLSVQLLLPTAATLTLVPTTDVAEEATATAAPAAVVAEPSDEPAVVVSPAAAVAEPPAQPNTLKDIFDLEKNPMGLILAAVFGLTPNLLIDRLKDRADRKKTELELSEATNSKPT